MLTALVTLAIAVLPGALLGFVVPPGRGRWAVWAAAPVLTLGLIAVAMAWLPVLGLPNSAQWVLGAECALAAAAVLVPRFATWLAVRRGVRAAPDPAVAPVAATGEDVPARASGITLRARIGAGWRQWRLLDLVAVAIPAAICVGFGQLTVGRFRQPPGWDGMNHALLTRNILDSGSTAFTSACTTGSTQSAVSCRFYPLAADVSWAQATTLSGGSIGRAMTAWAVLVGPLALVVAVYCAVRILGARPVVAGCAAAAPAVLGPLWLSMLTGRVTEEVGPGLSVAVALLASLALRGRHPIRLGLLTGLGTAGILLTHTYDVLFAGSVAVALLFAMRGRLVLRTVLQGVGAMAFATMVAILPFGGALSGANGERIANDPTYVGHYGAALRYWVTNLNRYALFGYPAPGGNEDAFHIPVIHLALVVTLCCLAASPLCFAFGALRWARPWFVLWAVWTAIGIWTSTSTSGPAVFLSSMWYAVPERLRAMILPVYGILVVAGACALGLSARWLAARFVRESRALRGSAMAGLAAMAVMLCLVTIAVLPSTRRPLRQDLARRAPVGPSYTRVDEWLAQHTPKGQVVAYDRHLEFMTWAYADENVGTLFGIPPLVKENLGNYTERLTAWYWLVNKAAAPPAGCLVRKFGIAYVAVGKARMPGWSASYSRARLAASPNVALVHRDGNLKIYQVTAAGRACVSAPA